MHSITGASISTKRPVTNAYTYYEAHCYQATPNERTAALGLTSFLRLLAPLIWADERLGGRERKTLESF